MLKKLSKFLTDLSPANKLLLIIIFGVLVFLLILVGQKMFSKKKEADITVDQIMIQKGDDVVIINKNGLIEYRTKDKVFYKTWDSSRIEDFFASMQNKAREYLANPEDLPGCYKVTLWLDDRLVTFCVSSDDEEIKEIFDESEDGEDINISDFFNEEDDSENDGNNSHVFTSTPTPRIGISSPTPTPRSGGGGRSPDDNYPPVKADCINWSQDIVNKAIISNTLCTVED